MTPISFVAQVGGAIAGTTLLAAGLTHLTRPRRLMAALSAQRVVPQALVPACAVVLILFELSLGGTVVSVLLTGDTSAAYRLAVGATAGLYGLFAAYSLIVLRFRPGAPCGCGSDLTPITGWVVARAGLYAVLSLGALRLDGGPLSIPNVSEASLLIMASASLAILLWIFPSAVSRSGRAMP
ncbi:MAG TPA: MauE/DoxX family redox-associated membrane protein [Actinomycetota bacterium]|nr:MauE/DoxX family redox-associated membrane protein [Actinomycetota bacterium]